MKNINTDRHDLLCYTENGHVLRCTDCGCVRIRFREVVLDLTADDLAVLHKALAEEKDTVLYVGPARTRYAFRASEVAELHRLLSRAQLILTIDDDVQSASLQAAALFSYSSTQSNRHASA